MRTEPSSPLLPLAARVRTNLGRARRWVKARGPLARMGLLTLGVAVAVGLGYLSIPDRGLTGAGAGSGAGAGWVWILENRHLNKDKVARIRETLDAAGILSYTDRSNRVGVQPDRRAEALAVLSKSKVAPPTLDEIDERAEAAPGLFDGPDEIARRNHMVLEKQARTLIEGLDDAIDSAFVRVIRVRGGGGFRGSTLVTGFVDLRVHESRKLQNIVIEGIQTILLGLFPELKSESITVVDQRGRTYLAAGNRELKEQVSSRIREEVWDDAITEGLSYIPGVDVRVQLEPAPMPAPVPAVVVATAPVVAPPPAPIEPSETPDIARPNAPVAIEPDPPTVEVATTPPAALAPSPVVVPTPGRLRANVWVRVPLSFYRLTFESREPHRRPRPEELKASEVTTERNVQNAVQSVIQRDDLGTIQVYTVQDDLASDPPAPGPSATEAGATLPPPFLWGAVGVLSILSALMAVHLVVVARRPVPRLVASNHRADFATDEPDGSARGPSDRVRELIRVDPEAAASVLQRWIGTGEAPG